jgi:hypothetical protein
MIYTGFYSRGGIEVHESTFSDQIIRACNPSITNETQNSDVFQVNQTKFEKIVIVSDTTSIMIPLLLDKGLLAPSNNNNNNNSTHYLLDLTKLMVQQTT